MSILPINETTLRYGSMDAGLTVRNDEPQLDAAMRRAAEILNLKASAILLLQLQLPLFTSRATMWVLITRTSFCTLLVILRDTKAQMDDTMS